MRAAAPLVATPLRGHPPLTVVAPTMAGIIERQKDMGRKTDVLKWDENFSKALEMALRCCPRS